MGAVKVTWLMSSAIDNWNKQNQSQKLFWDFNSVFRPLPSLKNCMWNLHDVWWEGFSNWRKPASKTSGFRSKTAAFKFVWSWISSSARPRFQHGFHSQHNPQSYPRPSPQSSLWKYVQNGAGQAISHPRSQRNRGRDALVVFERCKVRPGQM